MSGEDELQTILSRLDRILATPGSSSPAAVRPEPGAGTVPNELVDRWRKLSETSALLNWMRNDFETVLEAVLDTAISLTNAQRGLLFLKNEEGGLDVRLARDHKHCALPEPHEYPRSIVDQVCHRAEPMFLPNIADREPNLGASVRDLGLISAMCVPLTSYASPPRREGEPEPEPDAGSERRRFSEKAKDELLGCIYLDSDANTYSFQEEDLYLFLILANHTTTALLKERLYREAVTDPLTRLFTRAQFERSLRQMGRSFERNRLPFSLILLDIDQLREINDQHGQLIGDAVLRETSDLLVATVRQDDLCFRYGGDEFAVLLRETDGEGALTVGEKIRQALAEHRFGEEVRLTVSLGAASCPAHAGGGTDLTRKADQALYQAKQKGRDRLQLWSPELSPVAPRHDRLAGVLTGNYSRDYNNVSLLVETFDALSKTHDVHEVLTLAVDKAMEASDAERGAIMLADEKGTLSTIVARGRNRATLELKERFSRSIPEKVLRSGEAVFVITSDSPEPGSDSMRELGLRTVLCAPLLAETGRIGCLYVDARKGEQEILEGSLPFFSALARHIALAVENARLRARLQLES